MNTRDILKERLIRSIRKGCALTVMAGARFSDASNLERIKILSDYCLSHGLTDSIVQAILDDWKITERPRGGRRA